MKKALFLLSVFVLTGTLFLQAKDTTKVKKSPRPFVYTLVYNRIPDKSFVPLIGFVNIAEGNHKGLQMGFINRTQISFKGLQMGFGNTVSNQFTGVELGFLNAVGNTSTGLSAGFINAAGNTVTGAQMGFINATGNEFKGISLGFMNATGNKLTGIQCGFINVSGNEFKGLQVGFSNTTGNKFRGLQAGFLNVTKNSFTGIGLGFVNLVSNKMKGIQLGFINKNHALSGFQLGFVNIVDTLEKGFPVGVVNIIKRGGYRAFEVGASGMFPVNVSYKSGTRKLYTSINASYGINLNNLAAFGLGLGTILPLKNNWNFNPEINSYIAFDNWSQVYSLRLNALYEFSHNISLTFGPDVSCDHSVKNGDFQQPLFYLLSSNLDARNKLIVGLNVALRYRF